MRVRFPGPALAVLLAAAGLPVLAAVTNEQLPGLFRGFGTVKPFAEGERVTFLGDSITHGGGYHVGLQLYWDLRHPGSGTRLMNGGVSGDGAGGGAGRWSWDVLPQRADRTFVMFGMNDVGGADYDSPTPDAATLASRASNLAHYATNLAAVADCVLRAGQKLVILTPTPYDEYGTNYVCAASPGRNEIGLAACAETGRRLAAERKAELVDLHRPLTDFVRRQSDYCFCNPNDRVHPFVDGHLIVMAEILKAMGEPADFGGLDVDAKGQTSVDVAYAPTALPFPVSDEYRRADKVYPLTETVNRERLTVRNLPPGRYGLFADGGRLGTFTDGQLLAGVNLALLPTPGARLAKRAWDVAGRLRETENRLRDLVFVERLARQRGADPKDPEVVCAKFGVLVDELKGQKKPWAGYYERKLADYRSGKAREGADRDEENRLRKELADIGRTSAACTLGIRRENYRCGDEIY